RLGEMIAQDMITVRLTPPVTAVVVASPGYIGKHGRPRDVADLARHNCIGYRLVRSGGLYRWDLNENGKDVVVETRGTAIVTDSLAAIDLALAGVGLAYVFEPLVRADLAAGRLVQILPKTAIEEPGLFLYFPRRASMAPKLRAFIDTAQEIGRASMRTPGRVA
ncbi:MAG: LysR family transcriptional regulator, partial [Mesorhizobium sp.]